MFDQERESRGDASRMITLSCNNATALHVSASAARAAVETYSAPHISMPMLGICTVVSRKMDAHIDCTSFWSCGPIQPSSYVDLAALNNSDTTSSPCKKKISGATSPS